MNMFASCMITALIMLTLPVILTSSKLYKNKLYPYYVKTTTSYTFMISMILTMMFIHSGQEMIISNWHWMTI